MFSSSSQGKIYGSHYTNINDTPPDFFKPMVFPIGKMAATTLKVFSLNNVLDYESVSEYIRSFIYAVSNIEKNPLFSEYIGVTPTFKIHQDHLCITIPPGEKNNHEETIIRMDFLYDNTIGITHVSFAAYGQSFCACVFSFVYNVILLQCEGFLQEEFKIGEKGIQDFLYNYKRISHFFGISN